MLYVAGVTNRLGTIEDGTTTSDFEPEETRRHTSVQTAVLACPWKNHKINVIDTPGYADFRGEVVSGIRVADGAVIVVSAPAGVEVGTRQVWKMAEARGLPKIIYVSKMDRENAEFNRVMESITEVFGRHCAPVQLPIGAEASFTGIVDLLDSKSPVPDNLADEVAAARERLIEAIAEADDDLATKYLEGEELTQEELIQGLNQGIAAGSIVPVLFGASTSQIGTSELLNAILDYVPSPADAPAQDAKNVGSGDDLKLECNSEGPLAAFVFKTSADPFVGKLSYFRVYSGTFRSDSQVWNANKGEAERVGQLYEITGKAQTPASDFAAGDIGAVAKLNTVLTGHTIATRDNPITLEGLKFPHPVYQMAIYPKSKADVDKMTSSLTRIGEEDPSLAIQRQPETLEMIIGGLGDTHIDTTVEKMKRKFGVELVLELPKVPYKETIGASTRVEYRHKKQSGGHGQFGHVWLNLEPLPRGAGFEFADSVVGGSVPREYIPSVEKGVNRALLEGAVAGFPIVDLKATLFDGSFHPVDSSGVCFEIAGSGALKDGVKKASPTLLEPVMKVRITVPDEYMGDVIGEMNSKRGRIQGMTPEGDGTTTVEAEVPQSEMLRYATELRSQTQGQGLFTMEYDHYEEVPAHMVDRVIAAEREREEARA
jgi:elongation factor G